MTFPPPTTAPAGWYPDPSGGPFVRYFDGRQWTSHVTRVAPPAPEPRPEHPTLPFAVVIGAVAVLTASLIGSRLLLDQLIGRGWPVPALMLITVLAGYGPSVAWLWFASRKWGSGNPLADTGVRFRWVDLAWAPLVWIGTIVAMGLALAAVRFLEIPYRGNLDLNLPFGLDVWGQIRATRTVNRTAVVSLVFSAVVCAPIVEEAIFRGAVLRGLLSKTPVVIAVALQAVMFGVAHFNPDFGRDAIGLMLVLTVAGLGFGLAAFLLRRIGPTIAAHAILNGVAVTVALLWDP